jgi:hypothetical protein
VFENRVLRRISVFTRDKVTGDRRKLHNEELRILYSLPNNFMQFKSRRMRWTDNFACMNEERKVYKVLVGRLEGKRPFGRPRCRREDGFRMDLR